MSNLYEKIKKEAEYVVKIWNDAAEDYDDYDVCPTKDEAQAEANSLKANGEKAIVEEFREDSRDPDLTDEVEWYNRNFNESSDDAYMREWRTICEAFCKKIGAELLFVNTDNFGYMTKDGQTVHMYADELASYLQNNDLTESDNLPNISKFIYDLDVDHGNAWSVQDYTKNGRGDKIIVVSRNGQSDNSAKDIIKAVEKEHPNLKGEPTVNGRSIWFYLKETINESEEPEEDKDLPFEERVDRAYMNCGSSNLYPTIKNILDYLGLDDESKTRREIEQIIYKKGYDWDVNEDLYESEETGMTITQYAKTLKDNYIDQDVCDTDIDMMVALVYDFTDEPTDYYNKFIKALCDKTKVAKINNNWSDPVLVCRFTDVFKPYNEECKDIFDMENSEFAEDEAYYEAVLNLEPLIAGNAGESTYKDMYDLLNGNYKIGTQEQVNESEEEISFDEIETRMANATDYDELYAAVDLIADPAIRTGAENMLDICKRDGDDVETAYSVTTTEYVDPYRFEENVVFKEAEKTWEDKCKYIFNKYRDEFDTINEVKDISDQLNKLYSEEGEKAVDEWFLPAATDEYKKDFKSLINKK